MVENIYASGGDLEIKYVLKVGDVIAPIGSLPFVLRYYNPNDETKYVEASFDGTTYKNIKPKSDHYIIAIKNVDLEPGRMFCWERIDNASANFNDGKRKDSSRYDVGKIVKVFSGTQNLNTQTNFLQGVWFDYETRVVSALPLVGESNIVYMVRSGDASNLHMYSQGAFHLVGTTTINLSNYYTKAETNSLLTGYVKKAHGYRLVADLEINAINTSLADKADKGTEEGGGLTRLQLDKLNDSVSSSIFVFELGKKVTAKVGFDLVPIADKTKLANLPADAISQSEVTSIVSDAVSNKFLEGDYALVKGDDGDEGKSAYDIAISNGFIGTELEWLASLVPVVDLSEHPTYKEINNALVDYSLKSTTYTKSEVGVLVSATKKLELKMATSLEDVVEPDFIYLVPIEANTYAQYISVESKPEFIGMLNSEADLSNYVVLDQLNTLLLNYATTSSVTTAINNLATLTVAKEEGKGLISTGDITKLSNLPSDAYSKTEVDAIIGDINTILESI